MLFIVAKLDITHKFAERSSVTCLKRRDNLDVIFVEDNNEDADESFLFMATLIFDVIPLEEWFIDSGASRHMRNWKEWFVKLNENEGHGETIAL